MSESTIVSPRSLPPELLRKYDTAGPRYTSYPTAPQFSEAFDREAMRAAWRASNRTGAGLSLYLHLPFCRRRCLYCGCTTEIGHPDATAVRYVDALLTDLDRRLDLIAADRPLEQLALGGGTPTSLPAGAMESLIAGLRSRLRFSAGGERSIEIDPRSVDGDYLDLLLGLGFTRFSFGVQDFDPGVQQAVGRIQAAETVERLIERLRAGGCRALNIDLMYGLPRQTPDSFAATIGRTIGLGPSRIALFGYAHVPWVSPHQQALERHGLPDAAARMELFGLGFEMLLASGYAHVGMDHFALPDDELIVALNNRSLTRNFMGYTTRRGLDLVGLGASAISGVGASYAQNEKRVEAYLASSDPWVRGRLLSAEDLLRRHVILELFCNFHLDLAEVSARFGLDAAGHFEDELARLAPFVEDGLLEIGGGRLTVTGTGRFFIRNICMTFDQYLGDGPRRYSRTV